MLPSHERHADKHAGPAAGKLHREKQLVIDELQQAQQQAQRHQEALSQQEAALADSAQSIQRLEKQKEGHETVITQVRLLRRDLLYSGTLVQPYSHTTGCSRTCGWMKLLWHAWVACPVRLHLPLVLWREAVASQAMACLAGTCMSGKISRLPPYSTCHVPVADHHAMLLLSCR